MLTMLAPAQLMLLIASKSATFLFPNVPIDFGIRHIHTPEHLSQAHPLTFPNFRILPNASRPVVHQNCALVAFDFEVGFVPRRFTARMFTDNCCKSHILVMDSEFRSCLQVTLGVKPLGLKGHQLDVDITPYMQVSKLARALAPIWRRLHWLEDTVFWAYDAGPMSDALRKYRLCVMHPETVLDRI